MTLGDESQESPPNTPYPRTLTQTVTLVPSLGTTWQVFLLSGQTTRQHSLRPAPPPSIPKPPSKEFNTQRANCLQEGTLVHPIQHPLFPKHANLPSIFSFLVPNSQYNNAGIKKKKKSLQPIIYSFACFFMPLST